MGDELAGSNANRAYSLAATSIAIFTFSLIFLYPRYRSGEIEALLFQATLLAMGVATFSFVLASFNYYVASLGDRMEDVDRVRFSKRGDRLWLVGYTLLFLVPSLILATVGLGFAAAVWFALWLVCVTFAARYFPRILTRAE